MKVAVVILNWNGKSFLEKFLPSVVAYNASFSKIIIADNGGVFEVNKRLDGYIIEVKSSTSINFANDVQPGFLCMAVNTSNPIVTKNITASSPITLNNPDGQYKIANKNHG